MASTCPKVFGLSGPALRTAFAVAQHARQAAEGRRRSARELLEDRQHRQQAEPAETTAQTARRSQSGVSSSTIRKATTAVKLTRSSVSAKAAERSVAKNVAIPYASRSAAKARSSRGT